MINSRQLFSAVLADPISGSSEQVSLLSDSLLGHAIFSCTMSKSYLPPFTITPAIIGMVADIAEMLGRYTAAAESRSALRLRRINRIRTIQGTLAIEGNTLDQAQITAILEGKRILAPPREVQEVRNAILVYEQFEHWDPVSERDLLAAHGLLMTGLGGCPRTD